ncbi:cytochrome c biogenesis protein ResB [Methylonatrum kenyense]|uniref:cytochrome c biogenesis protein ResB n=1 Tax=Methylonatrum kenyense TaxID=455253 RepID=UPI0020BDFADA|nr:cytochrome c biogenesis protein ResB [Methylonatrum kenyense]MCK8515619.1 cytochrome c biogenesis protein ResB [Methylonatrum kenyense]
MDRISTRWPGPALLTRSHRLRAILSFLGSMRLAVTLLVVLGIASVIGTVLQQNQPYPDYLETFGPFWFGVFQRMGLFDVYSAAWFLAILSAMLLSTSVCLWRRSPGMLRQMRQYQTHQQASSLRRLRHHRQLQVLQPAPESAAIAEQVLRHHGYRTRAKRQGDNLLIAGLAGRSNRLGYVALHLAIVVIAIGGLMDSNLALKFREWRGDVITETRALPITEMRAESRLAPGRDAFRGIVTIPEGERASVAFLQLRDGYVVRELPFELRLDAFRVLHYASGEPRAYESDVVLHAPGLEQPLQRTIRVNEPLQHGGYTIFQAGFGDGGSALNLKAWPLADGTGRARAINLQTFGEQGLRIGDREYQLRVTDFEPVNAQPDGLDEHGRRSVRDVGPRVRYELRDAAGRLLEFESYMRPMTLDGRPYFVSGVRAPGTADFRYLHIPADHNGSPGRFSALAALLGDADQRGSIASRAVHDVLGEMAREFPISAGHLTARTTELLTALVDGGQPAMDRLIQTRTEATDRQNPPAVLLDRAVDQALDLAYRQALGMAGDDPERTLDADDAEFLSHSLATIPALERFGAPLFLQLDDFDLRQASTLEITRAPGKPVVYAGFALLTIGVFLSFFVSYRRSWCLIQPHSDGGSRLLLASTSARDNPAQEQRFRSLAGHLESRLRTARQGATKGV